MPRGNGRLAVLVGILAVGLMTIFGTVSAHAATPPDRTPASAENTIVGQIKEVRCDPGILKVAAPREEMTFMLTKDTLYRPVKGCADLAVGKRVKVTFTESPQGKQALRILMAEDRHAKPQAEGTRGRPAAQKSHQFTGFVVESDCDKGIITVSDLNNKDVKETFYLDKDGKYGSKSPIETCKSLKKGTLVGALYDMKEDRRVIRRIGAMEAGK